jgi:peptidoglycan/xylan/chitin deacetylase (PgdA/CDA1 family)
MKSRIGLLWGVLCSIGCAATCASANAEQVTTPSTPATTVPVRFILTFDDGPDGRESHSSTASVLDTLADNSTQNGIKAVFFVQTRSRNGGATAHGRALIEQEHTSGHVLALHDGSTLGHPNHCKLSDAALAQSLSDGLADLVPVVGRSVTLIRPPYWAYNTRTLKAYANHDLSVLLTDISANDGKTRGYHGSPRRRSHMASEMERVRDRIQRDEIPAVDGAMPIVITFHDMNDYTAKHLEEYLQMIVVEARNSGIALAAKPFYENAALLERAAMVRASNATHRVDMVPIAWRRLRWFTGSD